MDWYWWILIGVIAVIGLYFKFKILGRIMSKPRVDAGEEE